MQITRVYQNADGDTIRMDDVIVELGPPPPVIDPRLGTDKGLMMAIGPQHVKTELVYLSFAAREVDAIQIIGDFDAIEPSSGSFAWASKTLGNGQIVFFDMSALPVIGETV